MCENCVRCRTRVDSVIVRFILWHAKAEGRKPCFPFRCWFNLRMASFHALFHISKERGLALHTVTPAEYPWDTRSFVVALAFGFLSWANLISSGRVRESTSTF